MISSGGVYVSSSTSGSPMVIRGWVCGAPSFSDLGHPPLPAGVDNSSVISSGNSLNGHTTTTPMPAPDGNASASAPFSPLPALQRAVLVPEAPRFVPTQMRKPTATGLASASGGATATASTAAVNPLTFGVKVGGSGGGSSPSSPSLEQTRMLTMLRSDNLCLQFPVSYSLVLPARGGGGGSSPSSTLSPSGGATASPGDIRPHIGSSAASTASSFGASSFGRGVGGGAKAVRDVCNHSISDRAGRDLLLVVDASSSVFTPRQQAKPPVSTTAAASPLSSGSSAGCVTAEPNRTGSDVAAAAPRFPLQLTVWVHTGQCACSACCGGGNGNEHTTSGGGGSGNSSSGDWRRPPSSVSTAARSISDRGVDGRSSHHGASTHNHQQPQNTDAADQQAPVGVYLPPTKTSAMLVAVTEACEVAVAAAAALLSCGGRNSGVNTSAGAAWSALCDCHECSLTVSGADASSASRAQQQQQQRQPYRLSDSVPTNSHGGGSGLKASGPLLGGGRKRWLPPSSTDAVASVTSPTDVTAAAATAAAAAADVVSFTDVASQANDVTSTSSSEATSSAKRPRPNEGSDIGGSSGYRTVTANTAQAGEAFQSALPVPRCAQHAASAFYALRQALLLPLVEQQLHFAEMKGGDSAASVSGAAPLHAVAAENTAIPTLHFPLSNGTGACNAVHGSLASAADSAVPHQTSPPLTLQSASPLLLHRASTLARLARDPVHVPQSLPLLVRVLAVTLANAHVMEEGVLPTQLLKGAAPPSTTGVMMLMTAGASAGGRLESSSGSSSSSNSSPSDPKNLHSSRSTVISPADTAVIHDLIRMAASRQGCVVCKSLVPVSQRVLLTTWEWGALASALAAFLGCVRLEFKVAPKKAVAAVAAAVVSSAPSHSSSSSATPRGHASPHTMSPSSSVAAAAAAVAVAAAAAAAAGGADGIGARSPIPLSGALSATREQQQRARAMLDAVIASAPSSRSGPGAPLHAAPVANYRWGGGGSGGGGNGSGSGRGPYNTGAAAAPSSSNASTAGAINSTSGGGSGEGVIGGVEEPRWTAIQVVVARSECSGSSSSSSRWGGHR